MQEPSGPEAALPPLGQEVTYCCPRPLKGRGLAGSRGAKDSVYYVYYVYYI